MYYIHKPEDTPTAKPSHHHRYRPSVTPLTPCRPRLKGNNVQMKTNMVRSTNIIDINHIYMSTITINGVVYASISPLNSFGGYIAYGETVQEAINNLFNMMV